MRYPWSEQVSRAEEERIENFVQSYLSLDILCIVINIRVISPKL